MGVLVDSNVLIDIVEKSPRWFEWSAYALAECAEANHVFINSIIYAEVSIGYSSEQLCTRALSTVALTWAEIPKEAAFIAGKAFHLYRKRQGIKRSALPDFFIGAHAQVRGWKLLTRDTKRYASYFPDVKLIAP